MNCFSATLIPYLEDNQEDTYILAAKTTSIDSTHFFPIETNALYIYIQLFPLFCLISISSFARLS